MALVTGYHLERRRLAQWLGLSDVHNYKHDGPAWRDFDPFAIMEDALRLQSQISELGLGHMYSWCLFDLLRKDGLDVQRYALWLVANATAEQRARAVLGMLDALEQGSSPTRKPPAQVTPAGSEPALSA